jgi:hypothetical protein
VRSRVYRLDEKKTYSAFSTTGMIIPYTHALPTSRRLVSRRNGCCNDGNIFKEGAERKTELKEDSWYSGTFDLSQWILVSLLYVPTQDGHQSTPRLGWLPSNGIANMRCK